MWYEIKRAKLLLFWVFFSIILLGELLNFIEVSADDSGRHFVEGFAQLFAGNWPIEANRKTIWFALLAGFKIVLMIGAISGAWLAVVRIRDLLEIETMKLRALMSGRDRAIARAVLQTFPKEEQNAKRQAINAAVAKGANDWLHKYVRHQPISEDELRALKSELSDEQAVMNG